MRFITSFLVAVFSVFMFMEMTAFAGTPYSPEVNKRFKLLEALPSNVAPTVNGIGNMRVARVSFDSTTQGTSSASAYSLGVTLPANSLIWDGVVYVTSAFSGSGSVALECEDSKNIMADQTVSGMTLASKKALTPVGTAASAVAGIGAACAISARVSNANVIGKFDAWIEYFVTD